MRKKIILITFCLILFLIFTATSYGTIDPKYRQREHPEQELISPPNGDQFDDALLLITPNWNGISLLIYIKKDSRKENPNSQRVTTQEVKSKTNNVERVR